MAATNVAASTASTTGNVRSSSTARKWTSKHVIARLKRECESRNIPIKDKTLKRQDYLDKLNQYDASQSNQTPRDWTKLQRPDLEEECKFLGVSLDGVRTKGEIIKKLEAHGSSQNAPTSQTQTNGQPSGQQSTDGGSASQQQDAAASTTQTSQWADLPYWDLFRKCKELGIGKGLRKKDLLLQALIDYDAAQNSQGASGVDGTAAGGAGAADTGASASASAGAATGAASGPPLPSPTVSQTVAGEDFDNPVRMSADTRNDTRQPTSTHDGLGVDFPTDGWQCYRNASMVMLLHCNRLMSWIQYRHHTTLLEAGVAIKPKIREYMNEWFGRTLSPTDEDSPGYSDIWCELFELGQTYFGDNPAPDKDDIEELTRGFWEYLTADERDDEAGSLAPLRDRLSYKMRTTEDHQDVPEFLLWLLNVSIAQPAYFCEAEAETENRLSGSQMNQLELYPGVRELIGIQRTKRIRCVQCGDQRNVKIRRPRLEEDLIAILPIPEQQGRKKQSLTLEGLLANYFRDGLDWRCDDCSQTGPAPPTKIVGGRPLNENNVWKRLVSPPEVLLLQIGRYKRDGNNNLVKNNAFVPIPEDLDLTQYIETRGLNSGGSVSAKYKLSSAISHRGTREGGHYVAYVGRQGQWYKFDDLKPPVTTVDFEKINKDGTFTPYVMLYERVEEEEDQQSDTDNGRGNATARSKSSSSSGGSAHSKSSSQGRGASRSPKGSQDAIQQGRVDGANDLDNGSTQQLMHDMVLVKDSFISEIRYELNTVARDLQRDYLDLRVREEENVANKLSELDRRVNDVEDFIWESEPMDSHVKSAGYVGMPPTTTVFDRKRPLHEYLDDDDYTGGRSAKRFRSFLTPEASRPDRWSSEAVHNTSEGRPVGSNALTYWHGSRPEIELDEEGGEGEEEDDEEVEDYFDDEEEEEDSDEEDSESTSVSDSYLAGQGNAVSHRDTRDPVELLNQQRKADSEIFARHWAVTHSIVQHVDGPYWWMGPAHQAVFEKAARAHAAEWNRCAETTSLWKIAEQKKRGATSFSPSIAQAMGNFEREFEFAQVIECERSQRLKLKQEQEQEQQQDRKRSSPSPPSRSKTPSPTKSDMPGTMFKSSRDFLQWLYRPRGSSEERSSKRSGDRDSEASDPYAEATGSV